MGVYACVYVYSMYDCLKEDIRFADIYAEQVPRHGRNTVTRLRVDGVGEDWGSKSRPIREHALYRTRRLHAGAAAPTLRGAEGGVVGVLGHVHVSCFSLMACIAHDTFTCTR